MTAPAIDHEALGLSRVATQYSEAANFRAFLAALLAQPDELEAVLYDVAAIADIDIAAGVNLDVIGDIVGVGRIVPGVISVGFFGFDDTPSALTYGEEGNPAIGGRFIDEGESYTSTSVLSDAEYRQIIRARIIRNHARGTGEEILAAIALVIPGATYTLTEPATMSVNIHISRAITAVENALLNLDILPRPAGVALAWTT